METSRERPTPGPSDRPSRAEVRLWERCARQEWPLDPSRQAAVVARLLDLIDPPDGIAAAPRVQVAAARALAAFGALALGQQRVDLRIPEPPDPTLVDVRRALLLEAESRVESAVEAKARELVKQLESSKCEPPSA